MSSRSRRRSRQQQGAQAASASATSEQGARQGAPSTGVRGWLAGAGRWLSDKYEDTTEAVGNFVHQTGQAASDLWDVATSSDVSLQGGNVVLDTDLDELMDVMPASVRGALQLDREASANRVHVVIDPSAKTAVLTSAEVTVAGLDTETLQTGVVRLQGVRIVLSNPGGGVPFLDGDFGFLGFRDADDNLTAELSVDGLTAQDVVVRGEAGPTTVGLVQVEGFSGTAAAQGGAPLGEGARTNLDFSVEGAVLQGIAQQGTSVSRAEIGGASGGMYEGSETAFLAADTLALQGATQGGTSLGDARVSGARVDVQNTGGGLVGLDGKADHVTGRVRVSTASVSDFDSDGADFTRGDLSGVSADFDTVEGTAAAQVDAASLQGLDTTSLDASSASLSGLSGTFRAGDDRTTVRASADRAAMDGVRFEPAPSGPDASSSASLGLDWGVDVGEVDVTDVSGTGVAVGSVTSTNVQASGFAGAEDSWMMARADHAGISDVDHTLLRAAGASVNGASVGWQAGGDTTLRARDLSASRVDARNFSADGLTAAGADVTLGPSGDARALLDHAGVNDATIGGRMDIGSAQVSGLTATSSGDTRRIGIDSASLSAVSDRETGGTLGSASIADLKTVGRGDSVSATVGSAELSNGQLDGHQVGGISATELSLSRSEGGTIDAGFGAVTASGVHAATGGSGLDIAALDARDGRASVDSSGLGTSTLGSVGVSGVRSDTGTAASASLSGVSARRDASGIRATSQSGTARDIRLADGGHIATLSTEGLAATQSGTRSQLGARTATATGIDVSGVSADSVSLQGALVEHEAGAAGALTGTFRRGDRGPEVARLQTLLAAAGHSPGTPDGAFGPGTERAVIAFQQASGLTPDGVVGSGTLSRLQGGAGPASTSGRFDGLQASGVAVDSGSAQVGVSSLDAAGGRFASGPGGPAASLDRLQVQDARVATSGGGAGESKADSAALIGSASRLVDDADITGSVGLNPGKAGIVTVRDGTTASGQIRIRDNHLDERNTRVDLSRRLAGPLWTSVSGVSAGRDGRLQADVNGWGDKDLAPIVNDSLGLEGDDMHSIGTMGSAIATSGGGGGGDDGPGIVDTDSLQLQGDASFRAGTLDAGQAGSLTLAEREHADQNRVTFSADGRGQVVAGVADLLTRGFTTGDLSGGGARIQDAQVSASGSGVEASAGQVDARDLRYGGGVPAR